MVQARMAVERLTNRKRVDITPLNYLQRCAISMIVQVFLALAIATWVVYSIGLTFVTLGVSAAILISAVAFCLYFRKQTKSVAVKGDTLILNSYDKRSLVTSLRSVKSVRTVNILGVHFTRLKYKLDGVTRKALLLNRSWAVPSTPEHLIRKAIELSNKERKKKGKS